VRSGTGRRSWLGTAVLVLAAILACAACIPPRPSPSSTAIPTVAPTAPTTSTEPPSSAASAGSGVVVDPSLLEVLPTSVAGHPINADPSTAAEIAGEGSIAPFVSAIAIATAFGPVASASATDYVVVTVARLRPGTFSDAFFRGWRDTFDAAVCQQAGGLASHAEADIGSQHAYIGTCNGGVHTYHVHLATRDLIVSMQGAGDGRWPEEIVRGLTE
jgi:hypothetical protein